MEFIIPIIVIGFVIVFIVAAIKHAILMKKVERADQAMRNNPIVRNANENLPMSDSMINRQFANALSKKATENFLNDYGKYCDEKKMVEFLVVAASDIVYKRGMQAFTDKVAKKITKDKKIDKIGEAKVVQANLLSYGKNRFAANVIVSNGRDEYIISLFGTTGVTGFDKIDSYRIQKGVAVGF